MTQAVEANINDVRGFAERLGVGVFKLDYYGSSQTISKAKVQALIDKMASNKRDRSLDFILHLTVNKISLDLKSNTLTIILVSTNGSRLIFSLFTNGDMAVTYISPRNIPVEILCYDKTNRGTR